MIGLPPKPKFTKDEITNAALTVAREKGIGAVSAREVAVVLGTSTRPIFTYYHTMDELKKEVRLFAENIFRQYVEKDWRWNRRFWAWAFNICSLRRTNRSCISCCT